MRVLEGSLFEIFESAENAIEMRIRAQERRVLKQNVLVTDVNQKHGVIAWIQS